VGSWRPRNCSSTVQCGDKDIEAIAIEGQGQAVGSDELPQQRGIAVQILSGAEDQGQDGAGGVVDGAVQRELGATRLEPREDTGVELHEGPHLRFRGAPPAPLAAPALPLGGQAEGTAEAPHGGSTEPEALDLPQLLGGMAVVKPGVGALEQLGHAGAHVGRQLPAGRRPAPQPVQQAARALGGKTDLHPLKLPDAHVHRLGASRGRSSVGARMFVSRWLSGSTQVLTSFGAMFKTSTRLWSSEIARF
jgi:hypothetical protein